MGFLTLNSGHVVDARALVRGIWNQDVPTNPIVNSVNSSQPVIQAIADKFHIRESDLNNIWKTAKLFGEDEKSRLERQTGVQEGNNEEEDILHLQRREENITAQVNQYKEAFRKNEFFIFDRPVRLIYKTRLSGMAIIF